MNLLSIVSLLMFACTCWLTTMEVILRHPGFVPRACVWGVIAALCLLTAASRSLHLQPKSERGFWVLAAAFFLFGISAFLQNARAAHFEGYLLVISVLLMVEGLLMIAFLGWPKARQRRAL